MGVPFYIDLPEDVRSKMSGAFKQYPDRFNKFFSQAINQALALLSKTAANDSIMQFRTPRAQRTGMLQLSFDLGLRRASSDNLTGSIGPTVEYAAAVNFGRDPFIIKNAFGRKGVTIKHPGFRANPYMTRIIAAAKPGIDSLFREALEITVRGITI